MVPVFPAHRSSEAAVCMIWQKGDSEFRVLDPWIARLPEVPGLQGQNFDFHHLLNDTLYFRPWGSSQFWKGRINLVKKIEDLFYNDKSYIKWNRNFKGYSLQA
jgi:hypothetical protein